MVETCGLHIVTAVKDNQINRQSQYSNKTYTVNKMRLFINQQSSLVYVCYKCGNGLIQNAVYENHMGVHWH